MLTKLIKLSNKLDSLGEYDLANEVDAIISEAIGDNEEAPDPYPLQSEHKYSEEELAELSRGLIGSIISHEGGEFIGKSDGNRVYRFDSEKRANIAKEKVDALNGVSATVTQAGGTIWDLEFKIEK